MRCLFSMGGVTIDKIDLLRRKSMLLPENPGVYIMKNSKSEVIYVGKAKALKRRVSQYFSLSKNHTDKVLAMVSQVDDFDFIITDSEFEALVLECSLIKRYSPKYNILLKDDKGYNYVKITNEDWPRILSVNQKFDDDSKYIGPYTSSWTTKQIVDEVLKIFKIPDCNRDFSRGKTRPCLNYYINRCTAPCTGRVSKSKYNENIQGAVYFLTKGSKEAINYFKNRMQEASANLEFEKAAELRDKLKALQKIREKQKVVSNKVKNQDAMCFVNQLGNICVQILRFQDGNLYDSENFVFKDNDDMKSTRAEFIIRYYSMNRDIPKQITLDGEINDSKLICDWLSKNRGSNVRITVPERGEQLRLIDMCRKNAYEVLLKLNKYSNKKENILKELADVLSLNTKVSYIEAYDISNLQGDQNVGGMVVFKDGKPLKSAYRKFKINGIIGQDDYGSMYEVIDRRIEEYKKCKDEKNSFSVLPDLMLIDGGKEHVKVVKDVLDKHQLSIPVFGMVKDGNHRTRAITTEGEEVNINSNRRVFAFITQIQDEVHRFTIGYHRQRKRKNSIQSELIKINGIGEKRAKMLLTKFKNLDRIASATVEELMLIPGMNKNSSEAVKKHFENYN